MMRIATYIFALLLLSCGYNNFDEPSHKRPPVESNIILSELVRQCGTGTVRITDDLATCGYVTSSDYEGNFYKTVVIEHKGAALEIKAGLYSLYTLYPEGTMLTMRLKGLVCSAHNGVLQVGLKPWPESGYANEYFNYKHLLDKYLSRTDERELIEPRRVESIGSLSPKECGLLVRVEGLTFRRVDGEHIICTDTQDDSIAIYISQYSTIDIRGGPSKIVAVRGILEQSTINRKPIFAIKPRYSYDIETDL